MKLKKCSECGKTKWTRRHAQSNWTCNRCIRKIQAQRERARRIRDWNAVYHVK